MPAGNVSAGVPDTDCAVCKSCQNALIICCPSYLKPKQRGPQRAQWAFMASKGVPQGLLRYQACDHKSSSGLCHLEPFHDILSHLPLIKRLSHQTQASREPLSLLFCT